MKRKNRLSLLLIVSIGLGLVPPSFGLGPVHAGETSETAPIRPTREQMLGLEKGFQDLERHLGCKPPAYDDILKVLDQMSERAKTIRSLKLADHSRKSFNRLVSDIDEFKKNARARSHLGVEDSMNRLAENCFRCHLTHDSRPGGKSSPPSGESP